MTMEARRRLGPMAVVRMPEPGEVILVVGDGKAFAFDSIPRAMLDDTETTGPAIDNALAGLDGAIKALEAHDSHLGA